jgi:CheY-like chemotaxis protein
MILCIDDEPQGLQIRQMLLQSRGYKVLTASCGKEALEVFAQYPVDAVILDYSMPEMNGGELAAELKRRRPDIKILMLSAYVDLPQEVLATVDARAVKGTSPVHFLTVLETLLA